MQIRPTDATFNGMHISRPKEVFEREVTFFRHLKSLWQKKKEDFLMTETKPRKMDVLKEGMSILSLQGFQHRPDNQAGDIVKGDITLGPSCIGKDSKIL